MSKTRAEKQEQGHTPGPWHTKGTVVLVSPKLIIAEIDRGYKHPDTATANANLIAAAPEMLAALKALFEHCAMTHKHWGEGSNQQEADAAKAAGRAAIAKALGRLVGKWQERFDQEN